MNEEIILNVFADRFNMLIKENSTDINFLADKLGLKSKSTIYRYLKAEMSPKITTIKCIAELFNVNTLWLMGYNVSRKPIDLTVSIEVIKVPVLGKISAGIPIMAEESFEGYALAPASQIKSDKEYFYLRVQGDSMNLKFPEGSIVLVEKTDYIENGDIGIVAINGYDATIKKYRQEGDLMILEPMSSNPQHTVQIIDISKMETHILGRAISYQGSL